VKTPTTAGKREKEPLRGKFNRGANREKETAANLFFSVSSVRFFVIAFKAKRRKRVKGKGGRD